MQIISKTYNKIEVLFSNNLDKSLYINASKIAKEFNKFPADWLKTKDTKEYIQAISRYDNIHNGDLVVIIRGGNDKTAQGTWIHKKLIISFARWLSSDFAVWCDLQIEEILNNKPVQKLQTQLSELQETLDFIDIFEKLSEKTKGKSNIELLKLDSFLTKSGKKSVLDILNLDLKNSYFSVSELGELSGQKGSEINQALVKVGFQISENGVWKLLENGKDFCFETQNSFSQLKWKFSVLEKI